MKTPIRFLTLIFLLSVLTILLTSCEKIEIPEPGPEKFPPPTYRDENPPHIPPYLDDDFSNDGLESEVNMTFEEALERIDFETNSRWGVAIKAFPCIYGGKSLLVYNPNDPDLGFYDSSRFTIHWFKDSRPVRSDRVRLDCVCKGSYAVIVINKLTQQGIGIAFHSVQACLANEVGTTIQAI